jgi:hypothetical protein
MRPALVPLLTLALAGCLSVGGVEVIGPNDYRIVVGARTEEGAAELTRGAAETAAADFCADWGQQLGRTMFETDATDIRTASSAYASGDTTLRFSCR